MSTLHPPREEVELRLFLCDFAQISEGKLTAVGAGWVSCPPIPIMMAIAGVARVPWGEADKRHEMYITLVRADGAHVFIDTGNGMTPYEARAAIFVSQHQGVPAGSTLLAPMALPVLRPPLEPGRYEFRVQLLGGMLETLAFSVFEQPTAS